MPPKRLKQASLFSKRADLDIIKQSKSVRSKITEPKNALLEKLRIRNQQRQLEKKFGKTTLKKIQEASRKKIRQNPDLVKEAQNVLMEERRNLRTIQRQLQTFQETNNKELIREFKALEKRCQKSITSLEKKIK
jgi:hypothetical protein